MTTLLALVKSSDSAEIIIQSIEAEKKRQGTAFNIDARFPDQAVRESKVIDGERTAYNYVLVQLNKFPDNNNLLKLAKYFHAQGASSSASVFFGPEYDMKNSRPRQTAEQSTSRMTGHLRAAGRSPKQAISATKVIDPKEAQLAAQQESSRITAQPAENKKPAQEPSRENISATLVFDSKSTSPVEHKEEKKEYAKSNFTHAQEIFKLVDGDLENFKKIIKKYFSENKMDSDDELNVLIILREKVLHKIASIVAISTQNIFSYREVNDELGVAIAKKYLEQNNKEAYSQAASILQILLCRDNALGHDSKLFLAKELVDIYNNPKNEKSRHFSYLNRGFLCKIIKDYLTKIRLKGSSSHVVKAKSLLTPDFSKILDREEKSCDFLINNFRWNDFDKVMQRFLDFLIKFDEFEKSHIHDLFENVSSLKSNVEGSQIPAIEFGARLLSELQAFNQYGVNKEEGFKKNEFNKIYEDLKKLAKFSFEKLCDMTQLRNSSAGESKDNVSASRRMTKSS